MLRIALVLGVVIAVELGRPIGADPKAGRRPGRAAGQLEAAPVRVRGQAADAGRRDEAGHGRLRQERVPPVLRGQGPQRPAEGCCGLALAERRARSRPPAPKSIAFEFADGPLKGQKRHGIYELAGNQLKLCYGPADKPKPTEFKAPANSGYFLETWARQK